jgi:hypothetical protein
MSKFANGLYTIMNPQKYIGTGRPRYRSGWEHAFMRFCDVNEHIVKWSSESVRIPYYNPIKGQRTTYVPDFLIQYRNKNNIVVTELIEIKPKGQSIAESKQNNAQRAVVAVNHAKWEAARAWCKQQGITFRVITEDDIFRQGGSRRKR